MNSVGIYFGPGIISVVETKGKKILNNIQISRQLFSAGELEEKLPEEVKIVALLKEELRKNRIDAKEATISLCGKDLIIRNFDIPVLPHNELPGAIGFEAKKYIPFKAEDLVSDYQLELDKINKRYLVLFVGIKKEVLDRYLSILSQSNIRINSIDYSAFSVLRLLRLNGISDKGITGIISLDLQEKDEINFTVVENGFPLFSRDIILEFEPAAPLEKFKTEMRISLDYYNRKFPSKKIRNIFFISGQDDRAQLEPAIKDMGLAAQFMDINRYPRLAGKAIPFSLSLIKAYSVSLSKIVKSRLKINLLSAKAKVTPLKEITINWETLRLLAKLRLEPRVVFFGLFICFSTFAFGMYRNSALQKELKSIISVQPQVSTASPGLSYERLANIESEYKAKLNAISGLIKKQLFLTRPLDVIPRLIPEGMWLVNFSFRNEENLTELLLEGTVYLEDSNKEFELVNTFLSRLKEDGTFNQYFKEMNIDSLDSAQREQKTMTNFIISCRAYQAPAADNTVRDIPIRDRMGIRGRMRWN